MSPRSKTYEYIVVLKEYASYKYIDWISRLMLLIAIVSFLFLVYLRVSIEKSFQLDSKTGFFIFLSLLIIGWWIFVYLQSKRNHIPFYRFALLLAAWGWFLHPKGGYIYLVYLAAAIIERPAKLLPEVAFDEQEIVFNSFPKKTISWKEVSNVVLKEGLLTIDYKNNKLFQREVNEAVSAQTEKEFNAFCQQQLATDHS
jgi:hypothetical protein